MYDAREVCVFVLLYGAEPSHFVLAQRVMNSALEELCHLGVQFCFGCNAVGLETERFLQEKVTSVYKNAVVLKDKNIFRYPMMRKMFSMALCNSASCMWFDHDSYISADDVTPWFSRIQKQVAANDVLGSINKCALDVTTAELADTLWPSSASRPAYIDTPNPSWWAAKSEVLLKNNWPPDNLGQKNGNLLFGEMIRRKDLRLAHFRDGVCINVNSVGVESPNARTAEACVKNSNLET